MILKTGAIYCARCARLISRVLSYLWRALQPLLKGLWFVFNIPGYWFLLDDRNHAKKGNVREAKKKWKERDTYAVGPSLLFWLFIYFGVTGSLNDDTGSTKVEDPPSTESMSN